MQHVIAPPEQRPAEYHIVISPASEEVPAAYDVNLPAKSVERRGADGIAELAVELREQSEQWFNIQKQILEMLDGRGGFDQNGTLVLDWLEQAIYWPRQENNIDIKAAVEKLPEVLQIIDNAPEWNLKALAKELGDKDYLSTSYQPGAELQITWSPGAFIELSAIPPTSKLEAIIRELEGLCPLSKQLERIYASYPASEGRVQGHIFKQFGEEEITVKIETSNNSDFDDFTLHPESNSWSWTGAVNDFDPQEIRVPQAPDKPEPVSAGGAEDILKAELGDDGFVAYHMGFPGLDIKY